MATNVSDGEKLFAEVRGFVHVWSQMGWKHRLVILSPGRLEVFLSEEKAKKTVHLQGCSIVEVGQSEKNPSGLQRWIKLWRSHSFGEKSHEGSIWIIEPVKGKKLLILVPKEETVKWRVAIKQAVSFNSPAQHDAKSFDSSDGSRRKVQTSSERSGRISAKRNLQLRRPWSLIWEATTEKANIVTDLTSQNNMEAEIFEEKGHQAGIKSTQLEALWFDLESYQGCTDFLKSNCLNSISLAHASFMIDHFKGCYQMGDSSLPDELRLEAWRGTLRRLNKTLVDHLLEINSDFESCKMHEEHMEQLWLACEVWVAGAVYEKIMGACKQMFSMKDKQLEQILAKLDKASPSLLGIRVEFRDFMLAEALRQFRMINTFHTPLEKAVCLRKTVNLILDGIHHLAQTCSGEEADGLLPSTDDLLSFMMLLMARAKVKYLQANACYMQKFLFLQEEDCQKGELGYHITNFVAACEYLLSAEIQKIVADVVVAPSTLSRSEILQASGCDVTVHANNRGNGCSIKNDDSSFGENTHSWQQLASYGPIHHNSLLKNSDERSTQSPLCLTNYFHGDSPRGSLCGVKGQQSLSLGGDDIGSPKWIRDNYQVKKDETATKSTRMARRIADLPLPGSSPEFILLPTYE